MYSIINQVGYERYEQYVDNVKWNIIFDGNKIKNISCFVRNWINEYKFIHAEIFIKEGTFGNPLRNRALDMIENNNENWVCFLDDDNILYPHYLYRIFDIINNAKKWNRNIAGILGVHELKDGLRMANNVGYNLIDTAQFTLKRKLIGDIICVMNRVWPL